MNVKNVKITFYVKIYKNELCEYLMGQSLVDIQENDIYSHFFKYIAILMTLFVAIMGFSFKYEPSHVKVPCHMLTIMAQIKVTFCLAILRSDQHILC